MPIILERRSILSGLLYAGALIASGCRDQAAAAERATAARRAPWEPVDPAFTGCEGG